MSDDDKKLPAIQNRLISAAVEIDQDDPLDIVYQHSLFCQVVLPRSRPEGRVFERAYRNSSISLEAGKLWDGTRWIEQPLRGPGSNGTANRYKETLPTRSNCYSHQAMEVQ